MPLFRRVIPTGMSYGMVTVHFHSTTFEVTTSPTEVEYGNGGGLRDLHSFDHDDLGP